MKPIIKKEFFPLVVALLEAGHAPKVFDDRYNMALGYTADTGVECKVHCIARPQSWNARDTLRQRFNKWLAEIAAMPEYAPLFAENVNRSQRARDAERARQYRRYNETAVATIAGVENLIAQIDTLNDMPRDWLFARDLSNLITYLNDAKKSAISMRDRSTPPVEG